MLYVVISICPSHRFYNATSKVVLQSNVACSTDSRRGNAWLKWKATSSGLLIQDLFRIRVRSLWWILKMSGISLVQIVIAKVSRLGQWEEKCWSPKSEGCTGALILSGRSKISSFGQACANKATSSSSRDTAGNPLNESVRSWFIWRSGSKNDLSKMM